MQQPLPSLCANEECPTTYYVKASCIAICPQPMESLFLDCDSLCRKRVTRGSEAVEQDLKVSAIRSTGSRSESIGIPREPNERPLQSFLFRAAVRSIMPGALTLIVDSTTWMLELALTATRVRLSLIGLLFSAPPVVPQG
jgi:hypothetical protein